MTGKHKGHHPGIRAFILIVAGIGIVGIVAGVVWFVREIIGFDAPQPKKPQQVTLIKPPPPPPKVKEQPPEQKPDPEQKKEEVKEIVEAAKPLEAEPPPDTSPPPAADLGVDADASGSGDSFGLQARKGGQALVGGVTGGTGSLYGWYAARYGSEIQRYFDEIVAQMGGLRGDTAQLKTIIRVEVDPTGAMRGSIIGSSGNPKMDEMVVQAMSKVTLREPPPPGLPAKGMKFVIMPRG